MQAAFSFLSSDPFILLFLTVGLSAIFGRQTIFGIGLGIVASAIAVGFLLSISASLYGIKLEINSFTQSLFYYLFMYGVGLRVGPSFVNSLGAEALKFTALAVVSCIVGVLLASVGAKMLDLPVGAAGGIFAGSQTMAAAIGSATQAVSAGVVSLPAGTSADQTGAMIAISFGITYVWGTVGIILITKYIPSWWGIDAASAARRYEREHGLANSDMPAITGWMPGALRAYRLENADWIGRTAGDFLAHHPQYRLG
jgi:putative transport protein